MRGKYVVSGLAQGKGQQWPGPLVFQEISLEWTSPSFHMILGPSGGGKSTLLKTLAGVWRPLAGSVTIDGRDLWNRRTMTPNRDSASRIGYAFQNNALFSSMRAIENIAYPLLVRKKVSSTSAANEIAMEWLKKVGLESSAWIYPQEMSGGMQKRLAIARTLVLEPELLFLDDPTAGLDPVSSESLMNLILELISRRDGLVVMVTNDIDRAQESHAMKHFLDNGKFVSRDHLEYSHYEDLYLT